MFKAFNKILVHIDLAPIYFARQLNTFCKINILMNESFELDYSLKQVNLFGLMCQYSKNIQLKMTLELID